MGQILMLNEDLMEIELSKGAAELVCFCKQLTGFLQKL